MLVSSHESRCVSPSLYASELQFLNEELIRWRPDLGFALVSVNVTFPGGVFSFHYLYNIDTHIFPNIEPPTLIFAQ